MKKTLSIVLALAFVVAAFASFALTADSNSADPFKIMSIKVTDGAGYSSPYASVDNAAAFNENQAAYVVVEYDFFAPDSDKYKAAAAGVYTTSIKSSTMDLSYATATAKTQIKNFDGSISAAGAWVKGGNYPDFTYDSVNVELTQKMEVLAADVAAQAALTDKSKVAKYFFAFIGVTKAATAGEIKASMKVASTSFATYSDLVTVAAKQWMPVNQKVLVVYDSTGTAKYTIVKLGADKGTYRVYAGKALEAGDPHVYLFDYVQNTTIFNYIGYTETPGPMTDIATAVGFTYDGKLVYLGADGKLGTSDDKDLTAAVADANTFFGFTFATSNPASDKNFADKTAGNPVVVTDTYAYVTAAVTTPDTDVDIAPTGDFSANIVIVLMASAVLAAAALAFVAKKARD